MVDYSLVPVEHQPDFENVTLVPVDHDPFGDGIRVQQAQFEQPQTLPQPAPQQISGQSPVTAQAPSNVSVGVSGSTAGGNPNSGFNDTTTAPRSASGDSSPFAKGLLQGTINAMVPGAYHSSLAQQQFRAGNYSAATLYGAEALVDAVLGAATLGASTRLGAGIRAVETVAPAATEGVRAGRTLYHYTDEAGLNAILKEQKLNPSLKALRPHDVRYGNGQYLTDIEPGATSAKELSKALVNNPHQVDKFSHYLEIDPAGLNVIEGRPGVHVIPNEVPLDLNNRILSHGKVPYR